MGVEEAYKKLHEANLAYLQSLGYADKAHSGEVQVDMLLLLVDLAKHVALPSTSIMERMEKLEAEKTDIQDA